MSYQSARAAFDAQLETAAAALGLDVAWENTVRDPEDGSSHLQTALLIAEPATGSIGLDGFDRMQGLYQVSVYVHRGNGSGAALGIADTILQSFLRGTRLTYGGFTLTVERSWPGPAFLSGDFFVVPVSVSWFGYD